MTILIAFPGTQDPYLLPSGTKPGPILALLEQQSFETIHLFSTPATSLEAHASRAAIREAHPESEVTISSSRLEDRTDIIAVRNMLDDAFNNLSLYRKTTKYSICVPADWPQMYTAVLSLAEREAHRVQLLEVKVPMHVSAEAPEVKEIRLRSSIEDGSAVHEIPAFGNRREEDDESVLYSRRSESVCYMRMPTALPPQRTEGPDYLAIAKELGIIGEEPCLREMLHTTYRFALTSIPVLITGETGTGKDLLARYVHRLSSRCEKPSITMNCAAITESLAESELFGVKKGAYTGALKDRPGKFSAANGGTLFLDEIGDLPIEIQAKILRALENGEIQPVGDVHPQIVNVRIVAATNKDLHGMVKERMFRDDLLSRLSVGTIHVPPLRDRRADIPLIAQHLLDTVNRNEGVTKQLTPAAMQLLTSSSWERWNVRELRTAIERAWTMTEGDTIDYHHFKILEPRSNDSAQYPLPDLNSSFNWQTFLDELRDRVFSKALEMAGGSASAAARILGVTPQAVSQFQQKQK